MNQYEDNFNDYKDVIKHMYKNLVNVKKDQSTNHVYVDSMFYSVDSIGGVPIFREDHIQSKCYVLVNQGTRSVYVIYNKWDKYGY